MEEAPWTVKDAEGFGTILGIEWDAVQFTPEDLLKGMIVELEHGTELGENTNVTDNDPLPTAQIAWAHLKESPLYYDYLEDMEQRFEERDAQVCRRRASTVEGLWSVEIDYPVELKNVRFEYQLSDLAEKYSHYVDESAGIGLGVRDLSFEFTDLTSAERFLWKAQKLAKRHRFPTSVWRAWGTIELENF
jgi:hypothetical protein